MSVIAYINNFGLPALFGDILFSTQEKLNILPIPNVPVDVTNYLNKEKWFPYTLMQKLYVLKNNVCIALAGDHEEMRLFLKAFDQYLSTKETVSTRDVDDFIRKYDHSLLFNESAYFILHLSNINDKSVVKPYKYPEDAWSNILSDVFTNVYATGDTKAKGDFLRQIKDIGSFTINAEKGSHNYSLKANINLVTRFIAAERVTLLTLLENWGAGFELIYISNGSFKKLADVTYIIFEGAIDKSGNLTQYQPKLFLHYKYVNNHLLINAVEIHSCTINNSNPSFIIYKSTVFSQRIFAIPPIEYKSFETPDFDIKSSALETNMISAGYALTYEKSSKGVYTPTYFNNDHNIILRFKPNQNFELVVNCKASQAVIDGIKKNYRNLS